jgi:hypothetical protein
VLVWYLEDVVDDGDEVRIMNRMLGRSFLCLRVIFGNDQVTMELMSRIALGRPDVVIERRKARCGKAVYTRSTTGVLHHPNPVPESSHFLNKFAHLLLCGKADVAT